MMNQPKTFKEFLELIGEEKKIKLSELIEDDSIKEFYHLSLFESDNISILHLDRDSIVFRQKELEVSKNNIYYTVKKGYFTVTLDRRSKNKIFTLHR